MKKRLFASLTALSFASASLIFSAPTVHAQDTFAQPSQAQIELYSAAIKAYKDGDYIKAIELQRSSLALGELNIIYLNLGRALFRNGDCKAAQDAYTKALTAPAVESPSTDEVSKKVDEYRKELQQCPGTVNVVCTPRDIKISVDGTPAVACKTALKLPPGPHLITSVGAPKLVQVQVDVKPQQEQTIKIDAAPETPAEPTPVPLSENTLFITGLSVLGGGLLITGGAAAVDQTLLASAIDDFEKAVQDDVNDPNSTSSDRDSLKSDAESLQTTTLILYGVGGAALLTGGVLTVLSIVNPPERTPEEASAQSITPWLSPESAGMQWSVTFD